MSAREDDVRRFLRTRRGGSGGGDVDFERFLQSIARQESAGRGNYRAENERTRAYGRYQILPENWGPWSKEVFGREVPSTPENQEAVARHKLRQYVDRFGTEGALVAWYGGEGRAQQWVRDPEDPWFDRRHGPKGEEPSARQYVTSIMGRLQSAPPQQSAPGRLAVAQSEPLARRDRPEPRRAPLSEAPQYDAQQPVPEDAVRAYLQQARAGPSATMGENGREGPSLPPGALSPDISASEAGQAPVPGSEATPRQLGHQAVQGYGPISGRVAAATHGAGSLLFGADIPGAAAATYLGSRLSREQEPLTWEEAREGAHGRREGLRQKHPGAYYPGMAAGLAAGGLALRALPAGLALQQGQRGRNIARLAGTGAAAGGLTGGLEHGSEGVLPGTAGGAVAGPLAYGALRGGANLVGGAVGRLRIRDVPALKAIAKRLRQSKESVGEWFERYRAMYGKTPSLAEILDPRSAEEMAQIARHRAGASAGRIFREAEEAAAPSMQYDLPRVIRSGGPTTTVKAAEEALPPISQEAARAVGRRMQGSPEAVRALQTTRMDRAMGPKGSGGMGDHRVPLSEEILEQVKSPDIQAVLPGPFRRRIQRVIEQGEETGSVFLTVRDWDAIRKALGDRVKAGAGLDFARLRDTIRDYVGKAVPEYATALRQYGKRGDIARGMEIGSDILTKQTRAFRDRILTAGGGVAGAAKQAGVRVREQAGARVRARTNLAEQFNDPERASAFMGRLARDAGLRANVRAALSAKEVAALEKLAEQYGNQLNFAEGVRAGSRIIGQHADEFAAATRAAASRGGAESVQQGARGALASLSGESPGAALGVARSLAGNRGLQERTAEVLGPREAAHLKEAGSLMMRAADNLRLMAPRETDASLRRAAEAQATQTAIAGLVIGLTNRSSAAFQVNFFTQVLQYIRLPPWRAKRVAELLTSHDEKKVRQTIDWLMSKGMRGEEILRSMGTAAATAAGVYAGKAAGQ